MHSFSLSQVFAELRTPPTCNDGVGEPCGYFPLVSSPGRETTESQHTRKSTTESWGGGWADKRNDKAKATAEENVQALLRAMNYQGADAKLQEARDDLDDIIEKLAALRLESSGSDSSSVAGSDHERDEDHDNELALSMNHISHSADTHYTQTIPSC